MVEEMNSLKGEHYCDQERLLDVDLPSPSTYGHADAQVIMRAIMMILAFQGQSYNHHRVDLQGGELRIRPVNIPTMGWMAGKFG